MSFGFLKQDTDYVGVILFLMVVAGRTIPSCSGFMLQHWRSMTRNVIFLSSYTQGNDDAKSMLKCKYLGGAMNKITGDVFAIPSHAAEVLKISNGEVQYFGSENLTGKTKFFKYKWLRAVMTDDNDVVIGLPCWAEEILKIHTATNKVETFGFDDIAKDPAKRWKWHGGQMLNNGYIYGVPANAERVVKIHPYKNTVELIGPSFIGETKYYGGILTEQGYMICVPYRASRVLKITPATDTSPDVVEQIGPDLSSFGDGYRWHGGVYCKQNGCVYAFPSHGTAVLKINTRNNDSVETIGNLSDQKYKWGGGTVDSEGNIWGMPSDADSVLKITTATDTIETFPIDPLIDERNKYQGTYFIYCIRIILYILTIFFSIRQPLL